MIVRWWACRDLPSTISRRPNASTRTACRVFECMIVKTRSLALRQQRVLLRLRSGPSKAAHTRTTGVKEQQVVYWANMEKGIKLILKTIGNRKRDCAWSCSRWQTQPEKICKSQRTNQYNVRSEWHWFVRCDLQIFSGCVCHLEQLHAQSPFLFPIVFSINMYTSSFPSH